MKEYKFNVRGAYGETNFGDDLLMLVFENYFIKEFPNSIINFEGEKASYPQNLLNGSTYNNLGNYDWLIYGGGTQFFAFKENNRRSFFEKVKLGLANPELIFNKLKFIKKTDVENTAFLGFGLGPFNNNKEAISYAKSELSKANFIGVRDEVSYNYCKEWEINSCLGADVVFSSYFSNYQYTKSPKREKKKIGIIVRDWEFEESGAAYILDLMNFYDFNKNIYDLTFIIFAPLKDKNCLKELESKRKLVWNPSKFSISSFLEELNDFDLLISARYHGAIIGVLLNKPVICIEIEPKLRILTEQVTELKLWKQPFKVKDLHKLVNELNFNVDYEESIQKRRVMADNMLNDFKENL